MLTVITILLDVVIFFTGLLSSITDFRSGKIYNHILKYAMLIGGIGKVGYLFLRPNEIGLFVINFFASTVLGFVFYKEKIWGAGDAKLWMVIVFLFPYQQYVRTKYMVVPSVHILMMIFVLAYCYVLIESIIFLIRGKKGNLANKSPIMWKNVILQWIFGFFFISILSRTLQMLLGQYYFQNQIFFSLLFLLTVQWLSTRNIKKKERYTLFLGICYILFEYGGQIIHLKDYLVNAVIVLIVILIGRIGAKYNYQEIATEDVKEGMILSRMTVASFQISRVKNLPLMTDETTKSRITKEEALAIKRWKNSKYGKDKIVIISILPFAIFELLGVVAYMMLFYLN